MVMQDKSLIPYEINKYSGRVKVKSGKSPFTLAQLNAKGKYQTANSIVVQTLMRFFCPLVPFRSIVARQEAITDDRVNVDA